MASATQENLNKEFHLSINGGRGNDYAKLVELIEKGADVNSRGPRDVPLSDYKSALAQAIFVQNYGLVSFLIDLGADINQLTRRSGWFPLHCVVASYYSGQMGLAIAEILLAHGANPYLSPRQDTGYGDDDERFGILDELLVACKQKLNASDYKDLMSMCMQMSRRNN